VTVRSTRLAFIQTVVDVSTTGFTCPAGWRAIVKSVQVSTNTSTPFDVQVWATISTATNQVHLLWQTGVTTLVVVASPWLVLYPGDKLVAWSHTQPVRVWISGTMLLLTGVEPLATVQVETLQAPEDYVGEPVFPYST
jgi:hypothetical protein